jgi:hypothetical protein
MYEIKGYDIKGYGMHIYCKITEYGIDTEGYKCTMSFGTGLKKFCLIASYSKDNPYEIYIDRIEKRDICIVNGTLSDFEEGTVKFVKTALCTMKQLYPHVRKYTLKDNSQLVCNDTANDKNKILLSYDYILKYNQTWYQSKFNAELPDSFMDIAHKSYSILDKQLNPLPLVSDAIPELEKYKHEYETSKTPREFIHTLRTKYGDAYCFEVSWLNRYMLYLNIEIFPNHWYISENHIKSVPNYKATLLPQRNAIRKLDGGTRKNTRKQKSYCFTSDCVLTSDIVGTYDEY